MEKSKRSMAKTIWLSIRDTFRAMPVITIMIKIKIKIKMKMKMKMKMVQSII